MIAPETIQGIRIVKTLLIVMLLGLSACTQAPFVDWRREAGQPHTVGESTPDRVAVCYNPFSTNETEIINMAKDECARTGREPRYDGHSYWSCRVFLPHRVYYKCIDKPVSDAPEQGRGGQ